MNRMIRLYGGRLFYSQAPSPKLPPPSVVKPLKSEIYYPSYSLLPSWQARELEPDLPPYPQLLSSSLLPRYQHCLSSRLQPPETYDDYWWWRDGRYPQSGSYGESSRFKPRWCWGTGCWLLTLTVDCRIPLATVYGQWQEGGQKHFLRAM